MPNAIHRALYRVRPAGLAARLKLLLRVQREVVALPDGARFWIDPVSNFGQRVASAAGYEPEVAALVKAVLRQGDVFVDAGANEGYFSILAARQGARTLALEPQSRLIPIITTNVSLNDADGVKICHLALSNREGTLELHLGPSVNTGSSTFFSRGGTSEEVSAVPLDVLVDREGIERIRLLKVDCEGAESLIIPGAARTLAERRIDFISLEFHSDIIGGAACEAIGRTLRDSGYELATIDDGLWVFHLPGLATELAPLGRIARKYWPEPA